MVVSSEAPQSYLPVGKIVCPENLKHLEIPLYVVWDSDKGKENTASITTNHKLLRLCGQQEEDWPAGVFDRHACFGTNLTETLRHELGKEYYDRTLDQIQQEFGLSNRTNAKKIHRLLPS